LSAIAVSAGPGSYTGLRVGMATAKGLAYALGIPMISISTLEIMAIAAMSIWGNKEKTGKLLLVPMIDARRMEVFTAVYDDTIKTILSPQAMIPDENSFNTWINDYKMLFFGNGHEKCKIFLHHPNACFDHINFGATDMVKLSFSKFQSGKFDDLAYAEPFYTKDFYTSAKKM
ncbi:MAG: tRNA (adenosine(37)-N6)-threonylcarbamoyltransferase complex dimerization subunit type 1 TsaB, partial [Chitinophagaceae bacterium]|nr:tRNA (adenosine(37)-N6)-threonylcarbamoyltransferase complex dimerization subunit type 1 TsaB [Chitinophagaceae bacterium]